MEFILQGDFANALDVFESTVQSVEALLDANAVAGEQALHDLQCSHLHSLLDKVCTTHRALRTVFRICCNKFFIQATHSNHPKKLHLVTF